MENRILYCPLRFNQALCHPCEKEDCAWYISENESCAIKNIGSFSTRTERPKKEGNLLTQLLEERYAKSLDNQ